MHEFNSKSPSLCELQQVVTKPICTKLICFDVVRLYINLGSDASPATPHRPCRISFTNIARGHHRRQQSTSTNSITSPPSPTMVIVNANKIFLFSY
jgi:hypothetical protein